VAGTVTSYERALRSGQEAVRQAFLDVARRLLVTEGPGALVLRRIASDVGCTTKVVYTMFGGKDGLAEALYLDGFERIRQVLLSTPATDDPVERIRSLAAAYRHNALKFPTYYRVMFEQAIPGFVPSAEAKARSRLVLDILIEAVSACVRAGRFAADTDPERVAHLLWASQHGVISLELAGYLPADVAEEQNGALLDMVVAEHLVRS
jgi:AcrR family transcriptional regulator